MPVVYKGEGISASRRARELILGPNWGRIQFPIHWCTLQAWWPHQGRTLTVERSPLSALVTKLGFSVSIGWQPIVPPPLVKSSHLRVRIIAQTQKESQKKSSVKSWISGDQYFSNFDHQMWRLYPKTKWWLYLTRMWRLYPTSIWRLNPTSIRRYQQYQLSSGYIQKKKTFKISCMARGQHTYNTQHTTYIRHYAYNTE